MDKSHLHVIPPTLVTIRQRRKNQPKRERVEFQLPASIQIIASHTTAHFAPPNMTFQLIQLKKVKSFAYTGCYLKGEGTSFEQTKKKKIKMLSFLFYTNIIPFVLFDQFKLQHLFLNNVQYQDQIFLLLSSSLSQRTSFEFFFI